jgi:hypothetical protein
MNTNNVNERSLEVENVDRSDYPDFCDAYFSYGEYNDGTPLTDDELETLAEKWPDILNSRALDICLCGIDY